MLKDVNKYAVVKEVNKYVKLIGAINDYMLREFGQGFEGFDPDGVTGIAYTGYEFETEGGKWLEVSELQVNLDVVNLQWRTYADGEELYYNDGCDHWNVWKVYDKAYVDERRANAEQPEESEVQ